MIEGMPMPMKWIIWLSVTAAALTVLFRNLKTWGILEKIGKEIQPNGGQSMKDRVNQIADKLTVMARKQARIERAAKITRKEVSEMRPEIRKLADRHEMIEEKFARFVDHEAKNDLNASMLLQEERLFLEQRSKKGTGGKGELPNGS